MLMIAANFYHGNHALRKRNTYLTALKSAADVLIPERESGTTASQTLSQEACRINSETTAEV
jgi:hypothetical protein